MRLVSVGSDQSARLTTSPAGISVPTAVAVFPRELLRVPRRFMERQANLARWTVMPRGGHFAPAEEPELMVQDIRAFFRGYR